MKSVDDLPNGWNIERLARMEGPGAVLMVPPDYFDVRDVKNDFMRGNIGTVDRDEASAQWQGLRQTFERIGLKTAVLSACEDYEDMVFAANPAFCGTNATGERVCVLGRMAFASREREVAAHRVWYERSGYRIHELSSGVSRFEGGGDAIWHPGRRLIWLGCGPRSDSAARAELAQAFGADVIGLELAEPRFYHLDTCFCALNESTVMIYPKAFTGEGLAMIRRVFSIVIDIGEDEATGAFACNAAAFFGKHVVIQSGATRTVRDLTSRGFTVHDVQTGEFLKAGGSVYCMKALLF